MRVVFLALLGSCLVQHAQAAESWLQRLAQAGHQSFQGTFIYERNGSFSTHAVWHKGGNKAISERLLQLDGPAQEVLRVDGRPQCVSDALAAQLADTQWPARELNAVQLQQHYDLRVLGSSRVAGRAATVLALIPRDQHRYAFELHLDDESALPLKSLLINEKGRLLERFQFVSLAPLESEGALRPSDACKSLSAEKAPELKRSWRAGWVPPGFELSQALERTSPLSAEPVAHLLYGDGLARFSVFIESLHGAAAEDARSQFGPTAVASRRMSTAAGDVMVTVIGEVPLGTAERVALSIQDGDAKGAQ